MRTSDRRRGGRQECIPGEPQGSIRRHRGTMRTARSEVGLEGRRGEGQRGGAKGKQGRVEGTLRCHRRVQAGQQQQAADIQCAVRARCMAAWQAGAGGAAPARASAPEHSDRRASESEHRAMANTQTHMHTPMRPRPSPPHPTALHSGDPRSTSPAPHNALASYP